MNSRLLQVDRPSEPDGRSKKKADKRAPERQAVRCIPNVCAPVDLWPNAFQRWPSSVRRQTGGQLAKRAVPRFERDKMAGGNGIKVVSGVCDTKPRLVTLVNWSASIDGGEQVAESFNSNLCKYLITLKRVR